MEPCAYKRVLLTTVTASRLLQARKTLGKISERVKLWLSSVFHTQMLVDSHLEVQDASSGLESTRSASQDPLMTRHESITCEPSGINPANDLDLPLPLSEQPPHSQCHVQNDGDEHRAGDIPEEDFKVENDHTALEYLSNAPEEPGLCKHSDFTTRLSWSSDTPSPPLIMRRQSAEIVESLDCSDKVRTEDPNPFVDMLCDLSSVVIDTSEPEHSDEDTQDARLRILITPPNDSWETSCYTADNNRIGSQYFTSLVVPPFYGSTSRLVKYEEWITLYHPLVGTDQVAAIPSRTSCGPLVFSPNGFQKHLNQSKHDRINRCYVAPALQRCQLKAVAFTASLKASLLRTRYDIPGFLENIEPQFKWIDPAEILIESFRHTSESVTIYISHRPCSVPHIAIHESPPNDPYVVWNNSPDSQNYCFLAISSPNPSLWETYDYQIADDCLTDTSSSLPDSSAPVTPEGFSSTLEPDLDILFGEDIYECEIRYDYQQYEDEFVVPQYPEPKGDELSFPSKSKFFIPDDEEDSLPPLDDWYITIANRCMPPEEAEAVAAAAAMSLSCH